METALPSPFVAANGIKLFHIENNVYLSLETEESNKWYRCVLEKSYHGSCGVDEKGHSIPIWEETINLIRDNEPLVVNSGPKVESMQFVQGDVDNIIFWAWHCRKDKLFVSALRLHGDVEKGARIARIFGQLIAACITLIVITFLGLSNFYLYLQAIPYGLGNIGAWTFTTCLFLFLQFFLGETFQIRALMLYAQNFWLVEQEGRPVFIPI
ncbi:MAG: hypothetical protein IT292_10105 [Deltaproteobacteria bacterium]|nr:hypothetical protein [Deltaproteobacteria bacterium]